MKKYMWFLVTFSFILGIFTINVNSANAITPASEIKEYNSAVCKAGDLFNRMTGKPCETNKYAECVKGDMYSSVTGKPCPKVIDENYCDEMHKYLKMGSRGEEVRAFQQKLKEEGHLSGKADGIYGKMTSAAATQYYKLRPCYNNSSVVISGVKGPQYLEVNQEGTWTVSAYNKDGGELSYSVVWGDERPVVYPTVIGDPMIAVQQSATFTHTYSSAGTYTPKFIVTSENTIRCIQAPCPGNGGRAQTSLTVKVGKENAVSKITVISPNGGEGWIRETTRTIKWKDDIATASCPAGAVDCYVSSAKPKYYDITLIGSQPMSGGVVFPSFSEHKIAKGVTGLSYLWKINTCSFGGYECSSNFQIQDGSYRLQVCRSNTDICDLSDGYFRIDTAASLTE
jgi:hypothetical protein